MNGRRNALMWAGVVAVVVFLWLVAGRTRLHLVDETSFILWVGVAALVLSVLYWWSIKVGDEPPHSSLEDEE